MAPANSIVETAQQDVLAELYGQVTSGQDAVLACVQRVLGCDRATVMKDPPNEGVSSAPALRRAETRSSDPQASPLITTDGALLLPIDAPDNTHSYLALEYADGTPTAEWLESPAVRRILPHIRQAMAMSVRMARQEAEIHSTFYVLEHHPIPMVLMDETWQEVFTNAAARELLGQRPADEANRRPSVAAAVTGREARQRINGLLTGECDDNVLLPITLGSTALRMLVRPAQASGIFHYLSRGRLFWAYLLGTPLFSHLESNPGLEQLGLSAAESRLVALMLQGDRTLNDIARLRGVSEQTVKKQLRSVFRKTGCDSQESLMCFLFEHMVQYHSHADQAPG